MFSKDAKLKAAKAFDDGIKITEIMKQYGIKGTVTFYLTNL